MLVALAVIAATLLNPLEVAISAARLIGAVLIETGVHTRLSPEYFDEIELGNTALPVAAGAETGGAAVLAAGVGTAGSGAAVASAPHCALRKSFHFIPLRVPASFAALYFALHSCIDSAEADVLCRAMAAATAAAKIEIYRVIIVIAPCRYCVLPY